MSNAAAERASDGVQLLLPSSGAAACGAGAGAVALGAAGAAAAAATLSPLTSVAKDDMFALPGPVVVTAMPGPASSRQKMFHHSARLPSSQNRLPKLLRT